MIKKYFNLVIILLFVLCTQAQDRIAVAQSSSDIVLLLDPTDGSIVDSNFIDLTSLGAGTPKDILQVNNELWISDQLRDRIDIFDLSGNYLSTIDSSIGLDNIRGIALVNGEIWVCNDGSGNGAPGRSIVRLRPEGTLIGSFTTNNNSPFDVVDTGSEAIIGFITTDAIERFDYNGNSLGQITTGIDFPQQIEYKSATNSIYVSTFTTPSGVYEFDVATGAQLNYLNVLTGLRGVLELGNGDLLVSNGSGIYTINTSNNITSTIATGSSQYFARVDLTQLSLDEQLFDSFSVSPNPTTDVLNIRATSSFDSITISNLLGQTVFKLNTNTDAQQIDVSSFKSGLYLITVQSGESKKVKKFIKR